jgi:dTDP-4-dehydrorhamnose reductase
MVWGKNSPRLKDIKEKILKNEEIEAFENIYLNHASDEMIAKQVRVIIEENLSGIFHLATSDIDSQFSFISKLANKLSIEAKIKRSLLSDIEAYNFGLIIKRSELNEYSYTIDDLIRELIN